MTAKTLPVSARLPNNLVEEIDRSAAEDHRDRSGQLVHLAFLGLAGRQRLKELERLAIESIDSRAGQPADTAAADHLARHRALCEGRPDPEQPK